MGDGELDLIGQLDRDSVAAANPQPPEPGCDPPGVFQQRGQGEGAACDDPVKCRVASGKVCAAFTRATVRDWSR